MKAIIVAICASLILATMAWAIPTIVKAFRPEGRATQTTHVENGIAINGGSVENPVVNNYAQPARELTPEQRQNLGRCLSESRGSYSVGSIANNGEANDYAKSFADVLEASGWSNAEKEPMRTFVIMGSMWRGVAGVVHGKWDGFQNTAQLRDQSPEAITFACFNRYGVRSVFRADESFPTGKIEIDVSERH